MMTSDFDRTISRARGPVDQLFFVEAAFDFDRLGRTKEIGQSAAVSDRSSDEYFRSRRAVPDVK